MDISKWLVGLILGVTFFAYAKDPRIVIETEWGGITVKLFEKDAPKTVAAFLEQVEKGSFNHPGSSFYRVVTPGNDTLVGSKKLREKGRRIGVVQGGIEFVDPTLKKKQGDLSDLPFIETTTQTGRKHQKGSFALGRALNGENTSRIEFFINVEGALSELNEGTTRYHQYKPEDSFGMPVIGRVTKGMKVVKKIYALRKGQPKKSQMLRVKESDPKWQTTMDESVKIIRVYVK